MRLLLATIALPFVLGCDHRTGAEKACGKGVIDWGDDSSESDCESTYCDSHPEECGASPPATCFSDCQCAADQICIAQYYASSQMVCVARSSNACDEGAFSGADGAVGSSECADGSECVGNVCAPRCDGGRCDVDGGVGSPSGIYARERSCLGQ